MFLIKRLMTIIRYIHFKANLHHSGVTFCVVSEYIYQSLESQNKSNNTVSWFYRRVAVLIIFIISLEPHIAMSSLKLHLVFDQMPQPKNTIFN